MADVERRDTSRADRGAVDDGVARMLATLLRGSRVTPAERFVPLAREAARLAGMHVSSVFLVDLEQRTLRPYPQSEAAEAMPVEGSLAGRAYQTLEPVFAPPGSAPRLLLPLIDGAERLGVVELLLDHPSESVPAACVVLADQLAQGIVSKATQSDLVALTRRSRPMRLAAELQWDVLPPLTVATPDVTISGMLEPCYEIGGDAFDYAINGRDAHLLLVDAMGHGLDSSLISTLTVGAYRNARREGASLRDVYMTMDRVVAQRFGPDRFATAQLAELDLANGLLRWINAGHPAPLLVRDGKHVAHVEQEPSLPIGLGDEEPGIGSLQLQPGDVLLSFTDGVVEARSADGDFFGEQRLVDLLLRALASGAPLPEVARRLTAAVIDHLDGRLQDDATLLLLRWDRDRGDDAGPFAVGGGGEPRGLDDDPGAPAPGRRTTR